jgi:hypothetical protein
LVEGTPSDLRGLLEGRVLELEGAEPERMKAMLGGMDEIEEAQVFGATVRLRIAGGGAQRITQEVTAVARDAASRLRVRAVPLPSTTSSDSCFRRAGRG